MIGSYGFGYQFSKSDYLNLSKPNVVDGLGSTGLGLPMIRT